MSRENRTRRTLALDRCGSLLLMCALLLSGCTAMQSRSTAGGAPQLESVARASEAGMPCSQATGVARRALLKLGYTITTVEPAKPDAPGKVVGVRHTGYTPHIPEADDV